MAFIKIHLYYIGKPRDPNANRMAEGVAAFLNLPESERRAMGDRGRRLVEERFTCEGMAAEMAGVYRWLVEGKERPASVRVE